MGLASVVAVAVFVALAGGITYAGYRRFGRAPFVYDGLPSGHGTKAAGPGFYSITTVAERIGTKLPPPAENASRYAADLVAAGYRASKAPLVFYGIKVGLAAAFLLAGALLQSRVALTLPGQIAYALTAALGGFRLPDFFLARRIKERRRRLRRGLPDALDLMIVCSEAGSAVDRAVRIVAREVEPAHPELADELNLTLLEVNAGSRRREALLRFAERTREPEVKKFVTVLIQADRFGTDIAEALRAHSEHLRMRRRYEAEERAGKVSIKLVFPIFLFILPCMLLVTVGPAAIEIWNTVLPAIRGE